MTARITIERILRDDDDASGQSIRRWKMESENGFLCIKLECGEGFIILRPSDVEMFTADLNRARDNALELAKSTSASSP